MVHGEAGRGEGDVEHEDDLVARAEEAVSRVQRHECAPPERLVGSRAVHGLPVPAWEIRVPPRLQHRRDSRAGFLPPIRGGYPHEA